MPEIGAYWRNMEMIGKNWLDDTKAAMSKG